MKFLEKYIKAIILTTIGVGFSFGMCLLFIALMNTEWILDNVSRGTMLI